MKKAIFLDRDGIINVDHSYVYKIEDFEFCEGVFQTLKYFQSLNYSLFIVTNQSGIGRGYYTQENFEKLTSWMIDAFTCKDIKITKVYHCPHSPQEGCSCRKPQIGMFEQAQNEFDIDMHNSWMIGDKTSDIQAGINANIPNTIFVNTLICKDAKYNVKSILDTIDIIKK
ncbi:D-glycero-beta-D-manno-heptose 1,7-bisphosphate 7-phosphatase [Sulfurospirillum arcachonense]|uniref:D-glycero-beta-D-manno-heptose 1,7-bisphosphate 7-phosphatase n=1 Tax=Sulfurospirillum arcachonense TaxID=57666 RepID=UPI000468F4FE|nr:D-glycero-beta-D-manno-heptose 1,7-bisphosphate 7-phosphatase [Sulfurospirillum arcachonense]